MRSTNCGPDVARSMSPAEVESPMEIGCCEHDVHDPAIWLELTVIDFKAPFPLLMQMCSSLAQTRLEFVELVRRKGGDFPTLFSDHIKFSPSTVHEDEAVTPLSPPAPLLTHVLRFRQPTCCASTSPSWKR